MSSGVSFTGKVAIYISSLKSHFDGQGTEYDPAEVTSFVNEKMKELDNAGTTW